MPVSSDEKISRRRTGTPGFILSGDGHGCGRSRGRSSSPHHHDAGRGTKHLLEKIQDRIRYSLGELVTAIDSDYGFASLSPLMYDRLKEYILRGGKHLRSSLLAIAYLGFAKKAAPGLYRCAAALEVAHDFVLIHDDIIDRADTRRGEPALHRILAGDIRASKSASALRGEDLSLVIGDILYAYSMHAFLSIDVEPERKLKALKVFLETAFFTGGGQFVELMNGLRNVAEVTKEEIYRTYDLKTAYYSFAGPLAAGAILGGAPRAAADAFFDIGSALGRAFQIRDDIDDLFQNGHLSRANACGDIAQAKKTILLWYAYRHSGDADRRRIDTLLSQRNTSPDGVSLLRDIIERSGSLKHAQREVRTLVRKACDEAASTPMKQPFIDLLAGYSRNLLLADRTVPETPGRMIRGGGPRRKEFVCNCR